MAYNDIFFYSESGSAVSYTFTATTANAQLDPIRMINQRPCWEKMGSREQKNKKIIIADWTASQWSTSKIIELKSALSAMIRNGFECYLWQNGSILALTLENINRLEDEYTRQNITAAHRDSILATATNRENKLTREQCLIADSNVIDLILNPTKDYDPTECCVYTSNIAAYSGGKNQLYHALRNQVTRIVHDEFSEQANIALWECQRELITQPVRIKYTRLYIDMLQIQNLMDNEELLVCGQRMTAEQLAHIKYFCLNTKYGKFFTKIEHIDKFKRLIRKMDAIEHLENFPYLTLKYFKDCVGEKNLHTISLATRLKPAIISDLCQHYGFKLNKANIKSKIWLRLCRDNSRVHLTLKDKQIRHVSFDLNDLTISLQNDMAITHVGSKQVVSCDISLSDKDVKHSARIINEFMSESKQFRSLSLRGRGKINPTHTWQFPNDLRSFSSLCSITLSQISTEYDNINRLLTQSSDIESLTIDNLHILYKGNPEPQQVFSFPMVFNRKSLKRLRVSNVTLDEWFGFDLDKMENLEELHLEVFLFNIATASKQLRKLKRITLGFDIESVTQTSFCNKLSNLAPNLEELSLINLHVVKSKEIDPIGFTKLKRIHIPKHCEPDLFWLIINDCPELEEISIPSNIDNFANITKYRKLRHVLLNCFELNTQMVRYLSCLPKLDTLTLGKDFTNTEVFGIEESSLTSVRHLVINEEASILDTSIIELLKILPNLETITCSIKSIDGLSKNRVLQAKLAAIPSVVINEKMVIKKQRTTHTPMRVELKDPRHNPQEALHYKRPDNECKFRYEGKHSSLNQKMVIEKLSQFLTLRGEQTELIPTLQSGICYTLAQQFLERSIDAWQHMISRIHDWDGTRASLNNDLVSDFQTLSKLVKSAYIDKIIKRRTYYVGRDISEHLSQLPIGKGLLLNNPWHTLSVKRIDANTWHCYDPNFPKGFKVINGVDALVEKIYSSIGTLICIESSTPLSEPRRQDKQFISCGGLLTLTEVRNCNQILNSLQDYVLDSKSQNGLFLRDNKGSPAWVKCLLSNNSKLRKLAIHLLNQFITQHADDFSQRLQDSMSEMKNVEKHSVIEVLLHSDIRFAIADAVESLRDKVHADCQKKHYTQQLSPWQHSSPSHQSMSLYFQSLLKTDGHHNHLVELTSSRGADTFCLAIQAYCLHTVPRPVFYVNSPDDLICSASFLQRKEDNQGVLHRGPGGPLYQFLQTYAAHGPGALILINYDYFEAEEIIRFNTLLDDERKVDGIPIPPTVTIVGVINTRKNDVYQGADFYGRFDKTHVCPFSTETLQQQCPKLPETLSSTIKGSEPVAIDLYHSNYWKQRLLGTWVINGDQLTFQPGLLMQAIASKRSIELRNAPWDDRLFRHFWETTLLNGKIDIHGTELIIPKDIQLSRASGYDWDKLTVHISIDRTVSENHLTLNPSTIMHFLQQRVITDGKLFHRPGILYDYKNTTLEVNVTDTLTEDQWAELLTACKDMDITLQCHCAPGVMLPKAFTTAIKPSAVATIPFQMHTSVFESEDAHASAFVLANTLNHPMIIDVSECYPGDLFHHVSAQFDQDNQRFLFNEVENVVLTALKQGRSMILSGKISPELADALAGLITARLTATPPPPGQLIIVSSDVSQFSYMHVQTHTVDMAAKKALACDDLDPEIFDITDNQWQQESLAQCRARVAFKRANPDTPSEQAWAGLHHASQPFLPIFTVQDTAAQAEKFDQQRRDKVNKFLVVSPYVFISGLTAVGKSTFIEHVFIDEDKVLYRGENQIRSWANDDSTQQKILFIDEANLSSKQWTEFSGLYNTPPGILIEGEYIKLSPQHKVIFAGNPVSYGDERKLAPFFAQHGNAVLFNPMPTEYIFERILKPVFANTDISEADILTLCREFLEVYRFLCQRSKDEVLISPRELQMMALLVIAYHAKNPHATLSTLLEAVRYYRFAVAIHAVPVEHEAEFVSTFMPEEAFIAHPRKDKQEESQQSDYLVTPSREFLLNQLDDLLALREYKHHNLHLKNAIQQYGGLGGIVIEGEPGNGKSVLAISTLIHHGYQEVRWPARAQHNKAFYRMPLSMSLDNKKMLLLQAFNEGSVVVIDEINSSPMMERLLNDLLMGKTPQGQRPQNPGFMIIGTQNPVSMAGRRQASTALKRRLLTVELPPYSQDEMVTILLSRDIPLSKAQQLVALYQQTRQQAEREQLSPLPTFRDLLRLSDDVVIEIFDAKITHVKKITQPEAVVLPMPSLPFIHKDARDTIFSHKKSPRGLEPDNCALLLQQLSSIPPVKRRKSYFPEYLSQQIKVSPELQTNPRVFMAALAGIQRAMPDSNKKHQLSAIIQVINNKIPLISIDDIFSEHDQLATLLTSKRGTSTPKSLKELEMMFPDIKQYTGGKSAKQSPS